MNFWTKIRIFWSKSVFKKNVEFLSINSISLFAILKFKFWIFCGKIEIFQIFDYSNIEYFSAKIQISFLTSFHKNWIFGQKSGFLIQISVQEKCCVVKVTAHYWFLVPFSFAKLLRKVLCLAFFLIVWRHYTKKNSSKCRKLKKSFFAYLILT